MHQTKLTDNPTSLTSGRETFYWII